jgi:hypothetical protein
VLRPGCKHAKDVSSLNVSQINAGSLSKTVNDGNYPEECEIFERRAVRAQDAGHGFVVSKGD